MIKETKIKELIYEKVANLLDIELSKFGFKYLKSKRHFFRQEKCYKQIISLYSQHSPISYDDQTEQLFLAFTISTSIEIPDFDKWCLNTLDGKTNFSHSIENFAYQMELTFDDFTDDDFFTPSAALEFKRKVSLSLFGANHQNRDVASFSDLIYQIPLFISSLSDKSDIREIFETRKYPLEYTYTYLLFFGGLTDLGQEQIHKTYQFIIEEIEEKLKNSENEASGSIAMLDDFIVIAKKVSDITFLNPYERTIKIRENQNRKLEFSSKSVFCETLRIDISQFEISAFHVNTKGDILLFANNKTIFKLNSKGETTFEKTIEAPKGFDDLWNVKSGLISGTDDFYINNFVITAENVLVELILPAKKIKNKKLQNPHITDLVFSKKSGKYLVLYENYFLIYSKTGLIEKTLEIEQGRNNRIITEKEWIITQSKENANTINDFEGNQIGKYEFGNGNNEYQFSNSHDYFICFGYSTKSQFYDLKTAKKETLWAHPTFIKDYKERMYNDIEHNFDLAIAKFSPDDTYIVGGAYHGKYVAWNLPKNNRIELLPKPEYLELFEPHESTVYCEGKSETIVTKPEFVDLDGQIFFKNRANHISNIIFLENGNLFLTVIPQSKMILVWNREFKNIGMQKIDNHIEYYCDKYLTQRTGNETIIYVQK